MYSQKLYHVLGFTKNVIRLYILKIIVKVFIDLWAMTFGIQRQTIG